MASGEAGRSAAVPDAHCEQEYTNTELQAAPAGTHTHTHTRTESGQTCTGMFMHKELHSMQIIFITRLNVNKQNE